MEIVIAILLALILVALVSGNKDAASSVGKAIRITLFLALIGISWLILIGYSIFYFYSYTEQGWYDALGIAVPVILPPFIAWVAKNEIKELFNKDNKSIFKTLSLVLLGVIAWVTLSVLYQEQKKSDPNLGWTILLFAFIISGCVILNRCLDKGWKTALTFKPNAWDQVNLDYDKLQDAENTRWKEFADSYTGDKESYEFDALLDEHYERYDAIDRERYPALEKVRGLKKKEDWWLFAFYYSIAFICFGLIGYLWDFVFAWVMTLKFIKGNEWYAYGTMIGGILLFLGLLVGLKEEVDKRQK